MPQPNPHFNRIDRAPYELGYLLQKLPDDTFCLSAVGSNTLRKPNAINPDALLIVKAACKHAVNANETVMRGIESLGEMLFLISGNTEYDVSAEAISGMGCLLQHLAVEAQFLQETSAALGFIEREYGQRSTPAKKGANHA